jgi:hypothetical protein
MRAKRLTMDTDYADLAYIGRGEQDDLRELFDNMAQAGFDATIWDCNWCGTALYHSRLLPVFRNAIGWASAQGVAKALERWDPLAHAIELGRARGVRVLSYFRLLEEAYAPFDGHAFFREHPEYWWQSRCGMYRMVGWPCYSYPEVREHMLARVDDLVSHGVDGFLFGLARTHIPYLVAYRWGDGNCFGFNPPIVEEFRRRHDVDLSTFSHVEEVASTDHGGMPFTYEHRWMGTEPYDAWAFRRLLGEGLDLFLREVRRRHPETYIAIECGDAAAGGTPEEVAGATFRLDLEGLCADGTLDEYAQSRNYQGQSLSEALLPRFQHVRDSGRQLTAWLNDIFSPTGGGDERLSVAAVADYVDRFLESTLDGAIVHESAFLLQTEDPAASWRELARLK